MDINIINLDNSNNELHIYSDSYESCRINKILKNIFKFSAFFVGILFIAMITFDLSEKIIRTYSDIDTYEHLRILENTLNQKNAKNFELNLDQQRILETQLNDEDFIELAEEENNKLNTLLDADEPIDNKSNEKEEEEAIMKFFNRVNLITYKGIWKASQSNEYLDNRIEGEIALKIEKYFNKIYSSEKIFVTFRLLDGDVIDKWIIVKSLNYPFANATVTNTTLTQSYFSLVEFGEIFDTDDIVYSIIKSI